jgi:hypothetical protein
MAPRMKEEKIKDVSNVFKKHKIDGPGASVRFETRSWVQGVPKIFVRSYFNRLKGSRGFLKVCKISGF